MNSPDNRSPLSFTNPSLITPSSADALPSIGDASVFVDGANASMAMPDRSERRAILGLSLTPGIGSVMFHRLIQAFGSASRVLRSRSSELRAVPGIGPTLENSIRDQSQTWESVVSEVERNCADDGQVWLTYLDPDYPLALKQTDDPSPILFVKGDLGLFASRCVAIVGTRHATRYGLAHASRIAAELCGYSITVVSGLARGIDSAAHRSALDQRGKTIAVLGGGLDKVHPAENRRLAESIVEQGLIVGEHPPGFPPRGGVFPQRNRVIAGLSLGVIVVEAGARSGALITARHAVEQNREVFAMPGPIDSSVSRGCHQLLRDGAALIESIEDLRDLLGRSSSSSNPAINLQSPRIVDLNLNAQEQQIYSAIDQSEMLIDAVVEATGLPVARVMATIGALETRGILRRLSGARIARAQ